MNFDEFPEADQVYQMVAGLEQNDGFGLPPNIMDTWLAVETLKSCSSQVLNLPSAATFVDQLQIPSLGFAATLTARMARLDVVTAGMSCWASLGLAIRYRSDSLRMVLACQTVCGGFSPAPAALPDITCTHWGVEAILLLKAMKLTSNN